ncbi:serine/threonine-protein kinase [Nocardia cyriacigeorgica]|uniref:serine/threonine-protein kinase n=1 Tax=Nocardia cyriacigeorgica TaxID=135487 RepID=UPI0018939C79|nr:serine/threonine-protein kinase [Nocardia cyriacigeorgica]MBF6436268.1 protein kinase [Nocardia cyriacigeorgica]
MLNSGDVFAGFTIERLLGQGGMGSVYLARHPRLDKQTALKLLNRDLFADASVRARFEREADLAAQLDHPSIVAVYDRGTEADQQWISMQYIDGADASSVTALTLPPERAVQIIEGVADALDYAHGIGVLHRDVKPGNILLARSSAGHGERVFLTDFGLARLRAQTTQLTQQGMFTATLAFASPEQMTGSELDGRSDQYSLACTLYWLLTGMAPFDSPNPADIIHGNLQLAAPPLAVKRRGLPQSLDAVLTVAMAKHPSHRFGTCVEFAAAARHALSNPGYQPVPPRGAPPAAYPPPVAGYPAVPPMAQAPAAAPMPPAPAAAPMPQYPPAAPMTPAAPPYPAQHGMPDQTASAGSAAPQVPPVPPVPPAPPAGQPSYAVQQSAPVDQAPQPGGPAAQGVASSAGQPGGGSFAPSPAQGQPGAMPLPVESVIPQAVPSTASGSDSRGQADPAVGSEAQQSGPNGHETPAGSSAGTDSGNSGAGGAVVSDSTSGTGHPGESAGTGDAADTGGNDNSNHPTTVTAYPGSQAASSLRLKGEPAQPASPDAGNGSSGAPATAAPQGHRQPAHNGGPGFGAAPPYAPNPHPGQQAPVNRGSSPALIAVFTIVGFLVVLLVLAVVVLVVGGDDSDEAAASAGSTSTFTPAKDITPQEDPVERSRRIFPSLLPQGTADTGQGYQGAVCTAYEPDDPVRIEDRALSSRPWTTVWECRRRVESDTHMSYTIVVYEDADDARAVLGELPPNSRSTGAKSGAAYTSYHWIEPEPDGPLTTTHLVVGFGGADPIRANALISVRHSGPIADEFGRLSSENAVMQWWADAPL